MCDVLDVLYSLSLVSLSPTWVDCLIFLGEGGGVAPMM